VLNARPPPGGAGEATGEATPTGDACRAVAAFGVPVASVPLVNRMTFASALLTGLTTGEAEPDGKAAREMHALWRVLEKELSHEKAGNRAGEEDAGRDGARAAAAGGG
jgi:hypothetical protein